MKETQQELMDIIKELLNLMKDYNKCTIDNCNKEKTAVTNDKTAATINNKEVYKLKVLSKKEQDKKIKTWLNNKKYINLEKCRLTRCNEIALKLINKVIMSSMKMKQLNNKPLTKDEDKFYKEFNELLKIQNITDKDIRKIVEYTLRIELLSS
jgi:hypothetical protein